MHKQLEISTPDQPSLPPLRFVTAGSVDDGKSTLIGRLLFDSKVVCDDQLEQVEQASQRRGDERVDLALLTDGLRAEREQGITIDVAYRHFSSANRRFVVADSPGHEQYTRNMVTGASQSDVAVILVDARQGVVEQTRRHTYIASWLGLEHIVFAVNKMDLVGFDETRFAQLRAALEGLASRAGVPTTRCVPICALRGDNVVRRTDSMRWYRGPTLLSHLERVRVGESRGEGPLRFPVQWVIRPQSERHPDYRAYAGTVAGGKLTVGQEVLLLPSGRTSHVESIIRFDREVTQAHAGTAVAIRLSDAVGLSRGDMVVDPRCPPSNLREFEARLAWLSETPLQRGKMYLVKHTTHATRCIVDSVKGVVDISRAMCAVTDAATLVANDIGNVVMRTPSPLFADRYDENRTTGALILIDEETNETVAAGMIA